jgi:hypothetical protein
MLDVKESAEIVTRVDKMKNMAGCNMLAWTRSVAIGKWRKDPDKMLQKQGRREYTSEDMRLNRGRGPSCVQNMVQRVV